MARKSYRPEEKPIVVSARVRPWVKQELLRIGNGSIREGLEIAVGYYYYRSMHELSDQGSDAVKHEPAGKPAWPAE